MNWSHLSQFLPSCPGGTLYTIRAGDTLSALAARFGTTVEAILAANPGLDPRNLQVARIICIPGPGAACPGGTPYAIQPGDTFFALARRFGVTLQALLAANPQADPNNLQIGQIVCIPLPPAPAPVCCVTLRLAAEIPPGQLFPAGATLFKPAATATEAVSVTFAAAGLPPPEVLGGFDAYSGRVVFPATVPGEVPPVFGVILRSVQTDAVTTWAGTRVIPEPVPSEAMVEIQAVNTATPRGGITVLRSTGDICRSS